jgi:SMI1 / KNR4 family (SUKH-1)
MPPYNSPSWKNLVNSLTDEAEFGPPAEERRLAAVEHSLGALPLALRDFLLEADGLTADYSSGMMWSAADVERRNREFRTNPEFRSLYMPFDHLLFFGDDAGGDQFAFVIHADGQIHKRDIYRWEHETDARSWFAAHLEQYLDRRLNEDEDDEA